MAKHQFKLMIIRQSPYYHAMNNRLFGRLATASLSCCGNNVPKLRRIYDSATTSPAFHVAVVLTCTFRHSACRAAYLHPYQRPRTWKCVDTSIMFTCHAVTLSMQIHFNFSDHVCYSCDPQGASGFYDMSMPLTIYSCLV